MIIFDGTAAALVREHALAERLTQLALPVSPHIGAIVFSEDAGSRLYTGLKAEAAARVGIGYTPVFFSLHDAPETVIAQLKHWRSDAQITGVIVQKPMRAVWLSAGLDPAQYARWWQRLVAAIPEDKDVDGLHPSTMAAIQAGTWREQGRVLPATCAAVLTILEAAEQGSQKKLLEESVAVIGKSDLLGLPLFSELKNRGVAVQLLGKRELAELKEQGRGLQEFSVIVTATGTPGLITKDLIQPGCTIIDAGEPKPDVDRASVGDIPGFMTPVPGGVGPLTIISLLENAERLLYARTI